MTPPSSASRLWLLLPPLEAQSQNLMAAHAECTATVLVSDLVERALTDALLGRLDASMQLQRKRVDDILSRGSGPAPEAAAEPERCSIEPDQTRSSINEEDHGRLIEPHPGWNLD